MQRLKQGSIALLFWLVPLVVQAQERVPVPDTGLEPEGVSRPLLMLIVLAGLVLLPIIAMMTTAFVKLVVVLSMLRNALGTQQIPPTPVITGLALILTVYVMAPVGVDMYRAAESEIQRGTNQPMLSQTSVNMLIEGGGKAKEPMRAFLKRHTHAKEQKLFYNLARMMMDPGKLKTKQDPKEVKALVDEAEKAEIVIDPTVPEERAIKPDDFLVLVPSFVVSELTESFQIAFIVFLPFLIIDIVVTNILLALGMFMVPPVTMSLPIKLLLFVMVDGWHILTKALISGYL